jgi:hypothetical protein
MSFTLEPDWLLMYEQADSDPWQVAEYVDNTCCGCSGGTLGDVIGKGATPEEAVERARATVAARGER